MQEKFILSIDIGGSWSKIGWFDLQGKLVKFHRIQTDKSIEGKDFIIKLYQLALSLHSDNTPLGICIGAPNCSYETGLISYAHNLNWKNLNLKKIISTFYKGPIFVDNDANLAALGESMYGRGKELSHFILITLGTGVGTGIIINNNIYRGNKDLAGEGGHVEVQMDEDRVCPCGQKNHLEAYLGINGIKTTLKKYYHRSVEIDEFMELLKNPTSLEYEILEQLSLPLAYAIKDWMYLLSPQAFILAGGMTHLGVDFFKLVEKNALSRLSKTYQDQLKIIGAEHSLTQGSLYGGLALCKINGVF